jgi:hypothetical protein
MLLLLLREVWGFGSSSVNARLVVSLEDMEGKGGSDLLPGWASMAVAQTAEQFLMRRSSRTIHEC